MNVFTISILNRRKEKYANSKWILRNLNVNLNGLFCIHYIMLSIGAGNNLFHSVRISSEGNFRMNNFLLKFLVSFANSSEP